jgi:hypothetical protein
LGIEHYDDDNVRFPRGMTKEMLLALTYEAAIALTIIKNIMEPPAILPPIATKKWNSMAKRILPETPNSDIKDSDHKTTSTRSSVPPLSSLDPLQTEWHQAVSQRRYFQDARVLPE